jgi:hypothetical protein
VSSAILANEKIALEVTFATARRIEAATLASRAPSGKGGDLTGADAASTLCHSMPYETVAVAANATAVAVPGCDSGIELLLILPR